MHHVMNASAGNEEFIFCSPTLILKLLFTSYRCETLEWINTHKADHFSAAVGSGTSEDK